MVSLWCQFISKIQTQSIEKLPSQTNYTAKPKIVPIIKWGIKPCDDVEKVVTYCVSNGAKILFVCNNTSYTLTDIILANPSIGKYQAEKKVEKLISDFKNQNGVEPFYNKGTAFFSLPGVPYDISFAVGNFENAYWIVEGYHKN